MATYASYRHIELDGVGCGKRRITKPPGGETSDIFSSTPIPTPPSTPSRKNHMASTIFTGSEGPKTTGNRPRRVDDSFNKLFGSMAVNSSATNGKPATNGTMNGGSPNGIPNGTAKKAGGDIVDSGTPRKNHQKSNIFFNATETEIKSGTQSPVLNGRPHSPKVIIGDSHDSASSSGNSSGSVTPSGSGTPNGSVNGDAEPPMNGTSNAVKSRRVPPGGHSTKLW